MASCMYIVNYTHVTSQSPLSPSFPAEAPPLPLKPHPAFTFVCLWVPLDLLRAACVGKWRSA